MLSAKVAELTQQQQVCGARGWHAPARPCVPSPPMWHPHLAAPAHATPSGALCRINCFTARASLPIISSTFLQLTGHTCYADLRIGRQQANTDAGRQALKIVLWCYCPLCARVSRACLYHKGATMVPTRRFLCIFQVLQRSESPQTARLDCRGCGRGGRMRRCPLWVAEPRDIPLDLRWSTLSDACRTGAAVKRLQPSS